MASPRTEARMAETEAGRLLTSVLNFADAAAGSWLIMVLSSGIDLDVQVNYLVAQTAGLRNDVVEDIFKLHLDSSLVRIGRGPCQRQLLAARHPGRARVEVPGPFRPWCDNNESEHAPLHQQVCDVEDCCHCLSRLSLAGILAAASSVK